MAHPQADRLPQWAPAGPVLERERIMALDVLRGVAVLGILTMNIHSFSQIFADYINPTAYRAAIEGADYWVWLANHLFFDEKMMSIFCMLYGAGIVLLTSRLEAKGIKTRSVFLRRSLWLLAFGLAHAYLLWSGDILVSYAICGVMVYPFRKMAPKRLLVFGMIAVAVASAISLLAWVTLPYWPPKDLGELAHRIWQPTAKDIAAEIAAYRGGWLAQIPVRAAQSLETEAQGLVFETLWRAGGLMLVGMALYKLGLLAGSLSKRAYRNLAIVGALFGFPLIAYGVRRNFAEHWSVRYSFFAGSQFNYWGSLGVALAWISLVMLATKTPRLRRAIQPFATAGRMAFSNYILETVLCTLLFYGSGFGLFARVNRLQEVAVVLAVWVVVLVYSAVWMRHFYFGPLEWLWRSLTHQQKEPFRRGTVERAGGSTGGPP